MKVIAGLGNPGERYANTPHNVGFDVADRLAARLGGTWKSAARFNAQVCRVTFAGAPLLLVKPQTFMNLSGTSVAPLLHYYDGQPSDLVVALDDADLPLGHLRIRGSGSNGGHHGLGSIIEQLGTGAFARVRIGIGRAADTRGLADQVLAKWSAANRDVIEKTEEAASEAALCLIEKGLNETMNRYNGFSAEPPQAESAAAGGSTKGN